MFAVAPLVSFLLLAWLFKRKLAGILWREACLYSIVTCGLFTLASTEFLSVFHAFSFPYVIGMWGAAGAVLIAAHVLSKHPHAVGSLRLRSISTYEKFLILLLAAVIVMTGVVAAAVPPNTWDSMTYHMARVAHWVQNHTVAFYPTAIDRQLFFNPWAEYAIAQLQVLAQGRDILANFVQWSSMLGVLVAVSLISRWLGGGGAYQLLTAACAVTLPNAIIQSTSTQNDFVAALWSTTAVYFIISNLREPRLRNALPAAGAVLLAVYTKHSVLLIILPLLVWMAWHMLRTPGNKASGARAKLGGHMALVAAALLIGFLGVFVRNGFYLGSMVAPDEKSHMMTPSDVRGVVSNVILHLGMHLRLGLPAFDNPLGAGIEQLHRLMGTSILTSSANHFKLPFNYQDFPFYEDEVPNFLFFVVFLGGFIHFLIKRRGELATPKGTYFLMSWLCFMLFSILVKWSPFDSRYYLPYFILLTPFVADTAMRWKVTKYVLPLLLAINAAIFLGWNASKPLVKYAPGVAPVFQTSRDYRYFYNQPGSVGAYAVTARTILGSGCRDVGVYLGSDTWEYPLWVFLQKDKTPLRIEHVLVDNASKKLPYPLGAFSPCVIVSSQELPAQQWAGKEYFPIPDPGGFYLLYSKDFLLQRAAQH